MGKAYSPAQRAHVRTLLESGRDEESIEKETGVSDRTIRRWKVELERTGRIGKPPESRTGRHRVLSEEVEKALFEHVRENEGLSVDDMLWWLYERHGIVVGTRTIRRVFERKGDKVRGKRGRGGKGGEGSVQGEEDEDEDEGEEQSLPAVSRGRQGVQYQSPYAPVMVGAQLQQTPRVPTKRAPAPARQAPPPPPPPPAVDMEDDEEMLQLELQQIALQKREVELKLKMRRLQAAKGSPATSTGRKTAATVTTPLSAPPSTASTLYNPRSAAAAPTPPKRDSRSKKKIQESKLRTAERQERMLRELERRSRRRDHLTAEWVTSKDIWPLRAQGMLANLMHQYGCYVYTPSHEAVFGQMYGDLYELVDLAKGDWNAEIHDELLRERMKRKMGQLRTKMLKTGEIVGCAVGGGVGRGVGNVGGEEFGPGSSGGAHTEFRRVEGFTGQTAGEDDDEVEGVGGEEGDVEGGAQRRLEDEPQMGQHQHSHSHPHQDMVDHAPQQMQYELPPDHGGLHHPGQGMGGPYGNANLMHSGQYPMMPPGHHHQAQMLPYGMDGAQHGVAQDGMVL